MEKFFKHAYPSKPLAPEILDVGGLEDVILRNVLNSWQTARGDGPFPESPAPMLKAIRQVLKYVHLSDVVDGGRDFRFRLLGEAVFPGLDKNQKGRLVSDHPDPGIQLRYMRLMRSVVETARPVRGLSRRITNDPRHNCVIESLWLPFGEGGAVQKIMSVASIVVLTGASR